MFFLVILRKLESIMFQGNVPQPKFSSFDRTTLAATTLPTDYVRQTKQIRASNTSGECSFDMEFRRGNMKWRGQQKECVKRRAELSVKAMPGCSDKVKT